MPFSTLYIVWRDRDPLYLLLLTINTNKKVTVNDFGINEITNEDMMNPNHQLKAAMGL